MTADPAAPVLDLGGGIRIHPGIMVPELVPADTIQPHPRNPRRGDETAIGESLDTNGLYDQVKVQRSTGFILSGNHTYKTLVAKGADRVPVVWLDVDDAEATRVMLSANRTADRGTYDTELLVSILTDEVLADDMTGTGYLEDDLRDLIALTRVPDLDFLGDELGEVGDEDRLVTLTLKVLPEVAQKWRVAVADLTTGDQFTTDTAVVERLFTAVVGAPE